MKDDLRAILEGADTQLLAVILLGANCGLGNSDCGSLPISAVDLESGWIVFPRPKAGVERRYPLWPEAIEAIKAWRAKRNDDDDSPSREATTGTRLGRKSQET